MTGWHLDDDTLRRYIERTDSLAEGASVEQHLLSCGQCRARVNPRGRRDRPRRGVGPHAGHRGGAAAIGVRAAAARRRPPGPRGAAGRGGQRVPRCVAGGRGRGPGVRRSRGGGRACPRALVLPGRGAARAVPGGRVQLRPADGPGSRTGDGHALSGAPADLAAHHRGTRARAASRAAARADRAGLCAVRLAAAGDRLRRGSAGRVHLGQPAERGHGRQRRLAHRRSGWWPARSASPAAVLQARIQVAFLVLAAASFGILLVRRRHLRQLRPWR